MKLEEYWNSILDFEVDYSTIRDAWEAGAHAMHEYLIPYAWLTDDEKEKIILREVEKFMKENG